MKEWQKRVVEGQELANRLSSNGTYWRLGCSSRTCRWWKGTAPH